jgi:DNA sulfur modification protein DndC
MKAHKNTALVINFSGGKDSTAMLDYLCTMYPDVPKYVVMADTGFEHTYQVPAIEWARQIVARYGLTLHVVRNNHKTYLEMVERRGKFPAPGLRQCTSDLKRDPINSFIRKHVKESHIVNCIGIRAAESTNRAKMKPAKKNAKLCKAGRKVWDWNPIFTWSTPAVLAYLKAKDLPLHPAYSYLSRFSCRLCIFFGPAEIAAVHKNDPQAFELVASLEERIGFTMSMDRRSLRTILAETPTTTTTPPSSPPARFKKGTQARQHPGGPFPSYRTFNFQSVYSETGMVWSRNA